MTTTNVGPYHWDGCWMDDAGLRDFKDDVEDRIYYLKTLLQVSPLSDPPAHLHRTYTNLHQLTHKLAPSTHTKTHQRTRPPAHSTHTMPCQRSPIYALRYTPRTAFGVRRWCFMSGIVDSMSAAVVASTPPFPPTVPAHPHTSITHHPTPAPASTQVTRVHLLL